MDENLTGSVIRQTFRLRKLEGAIADKAEALIDEAFAEIARKLRDPRKNPLEVGVSFRRARLKKLQRELNQLSLELFRDIARAVKADLIDAGIVQGEAASSLLQSAVGNFANIEVSAVPASVVRQIVTSETMGGALLRDWWRDLGRKTAFTVNREIQIGVLQNETTQEIVRRILGKDVNGRIFGGVKKAARRNAAAIVRTAITHTASRASIETFQANSDVTTSYTYTAVFDSRTTDICLSLHGQEFRYDDPNKRLPPQHFACRSTVTPNIDWQKLGVDPDDLPVGTRATRSIPGTGKPGQIPSDLSMSDWLHGQTDSFRNELLGPTRAKLFQDGKLSLKQLVDNEGRRLTIPELTRDIGKEVERVAEQVRKG